MFIRGSHNKQAQPLTPGSLPYPIIWTVQSVLMVVVSKVDTARYKSAEATRTSCNTTRGSFIHFSLWSQVKIIKEQKCCKAYQCKSIIRKDNQSIAKWIMYKHHQGRQSIARWTNTKPAFTVWVLLKLFSHVTHPLKCLPQQNILSQTTSRKTSHDTTESPKKPKIDISHLMTYHHSRNVLAIGSNTFLDRLVRVSISKRMRFEKMLMRITPKVAMIRSHVYQEVFTKGLREERQEQVSNPYRRTIDSSSLSMVGLLWSTHCRGLIWPRYSVRVLWLSSLVSFWTPS